MRTTIWIVLSLLLSVVSVPAQECRSYAFPVELQAGNDFKQSIGGGMLLDISAGSEDGWFITLYPESQAGKESKDDYFYPANPPIRFNSLQYLGAAYGETTAYLIKRERDLRFILNKSGYDKISALITDALWPYNSKDPDHAAETYVGALSKMRVGNIRYKPLDSKFSPDGKVQWAKFEITVTAPADFPFPSNAKTSADACPEPFHP